MNNILRHAGGIVAAFVVFTAGCQPQANQGAENLIGLWHAQRTFTQGVEGPLSITHNGGWSAKIAGYSIPVEVAGNQVRFSVPGGRGYFRGRLSGGGEEITGHWVQPWTYNGFARFASPVTLTLEGDGRWAGEVKPLRDTMNFFLVLRKTEEGGIAGFIRNPEANIGRFYPIASVAVDGGKVRFLAGDGEVRLEGFYDAGQDRLSVYFPLNGGAYDFIRADSDPGTPFYPRPEGARDYHYAVPSPGGGWETASLEDVGMERAPLEAMIQGIIDTPMDAIDAPSVHAVLVARHGKLVVEEYFHGFSRDLPHGTRSASKTVTATLAGIAVHQGILSLDSPVYDVMYGGQPPADLDPRAARMTLRHLITMTSGLDCDDFTYDNPGNEDVMQSQEEEPDWHRYTLELEMVHEPGAHAAYCSAGMNLAGGVVSKASGRWLPAFYREHFAKPLGAGLYHMNLTPAGEGYGGGGLYIKARDFLKLGQLYLNDGIWNGKRLLDPGWADAATTPYNHIGDEGYGYGWWIFSYPYRDREVKAYYAGGNGGQYVIVVPELDLTIVIFAGNYNQRVMHQTKYELVPEYILKAIKDD